MLNPREDDNLGTMVCFHGRYALGDRGHGLTVEAAKMAEAKSEIDGTAVLLLPLYLYDHSGITMSVKPFSCPFDSGKVGFIYATYNQIRKEYGVKRISKKVLEQARLRLIAEVEEYDRYLCGEQVED